MRDREQILDQRQRIRAEYGALLDEVASILFELDPIGINLGMNTDEYDSEAETILPRLRSCRSVGDARRVVHEEFVRWFTPVAAGPESKYQRAAEAIWAAWQRHQPD